MSTLFNHAMRYEWTDRNPIRLVRQSAKRLSTPDVLTAEEIGKLLAKLDGASDGEVKLTIGQGFDMGRPSLLLTRIRKQGGKVISAHVGGASVFMMEGTFRLEGEE